MRRLSLQGRMLALSAAATLLALLLAGWAISGVLERFVIEGLDRRLDSQVALLASAVQPDGRIDAQQLQARRGALEQGPGWQWRIVGPRGQLASADFPSLRPPHLPGPPPPPLPNGARAAPPPPMPEAGSITALDGTDDGQHAVHARQLVIAKSGGSVTVTAAAPQAVIARPIRAAIMPLLAALGLLGLFLALAAVVQLRLGLRPLRRLQSELGEIRAGRRERIGEDQPAELQPLAQELNALAADNRAALATARLSSANLAHALKTPLTVLALDLRSEPHRAAQVARVEATIRHHLARARAQAVNKRSATPLGPVLADLVAVIERMQAGRALSVRVDAAGDLAAAIDSNDLTELLGNLLDNAARHARSSVTIEARHDPADGRRLLVPIEDDGPGISAADRARVLQAGERLDQQGEGYGFGLPIAAELTQLYGGDIMLAESAGGGLRVQLRLPAADAR